MDIAWQSPLMLHEADFEEFIWTMTCGHGISRKSSIDFSY